MYYLNNYFLFSFIGHLFETILYAIFEMHKSSGFLYLWWTPIYGVGIVLTIFIFEFLKKRIDNKKKRNWTLFLVYFLMFSLIEYAGGTLLEVTRGEVYWDYSYMPLHLGKYVSVGSSLLWTALAFGFIYWLKKYTDKLVKKIPRWVTIILLIIYIGDNIISIINA